MPYFPTKTLYSDKYADLQFEYRHVTLSKKDFDALPCAYKDYYLSDNSERRKIEDDYLALQMQSIASGNPNGTSYAMEQKTLTEDEWRNIGL